MKHPFALCLMAGMVLATPVRAADDACPVPAYLLTTESTLKKVSESIKARKQLDVLVIGSGSSALTGPDGSASSYPARLEAALRAKLEGVTINVRTELKPKKTSAEIADSIAQGIDKMPQETKPALTIWQTGTVDSMRGVDPDDFRSALDTGVANLQAAGTDVMLMNLQYSPRMETMLTVVPYLDTMRVVAQERNVPLFDRFSIMRYWSDSGDFDLFGATHGFGVAKSVHNCIGNSLSALIVEASGIKPAELGIQR